MIETSQQQDLKYNFTVNVLDGSFFGFALGVASYVTILPLFIASLTDSAILIGLVATLHTVGWQLPQLFTAGIVSRRTIYRPMVLMMTAHERWPYLGLGLLAFALGSQVIDRNVALILTLILICFQSMAGGVAATPWQSMISKIIPANQRGTFFGIQSMGANLLGSGGSLIAGVILVEIPYPYNFATIFMIAGVAMLVSFLFLATTRESVHVNEPPADGSTYERSTTRMKQILKGDINFRWFLVGRTLSQFGQMALAFYSVYALRQFNMDGQTAGALTGALLLAQTAASPFVGMIGDRWGHRVVFALGSLLVALSAYLALIAPDISWMYLVFILTGVSAAVHWTSVLSITVQFGTERDRPYYIGLGNTLIGPATILAPIIGGVLVDASGFSTTFIFSIVMSILATSIVLLFVKNPEKLKRMELQASSAQPT